MIKGEFSNVIVSDRSERVISKERLFSI